LLLLLLLLVVVSFTSLASNKQASSQ